MGGDTDDLDGELISRAVTNVQSRTETCQPFLSRGARLVGIILVNRGKEDRNTLCYYSSASKTVVAGCSCPCVCALEPMAS